MNIEHAYFERTEQYEAFEGLCFVDTLDMAERGGSFSFMSEKNAERVERQKKTPITVIIGNPPYSAWQLNENDNNKNRKYPVIEQRIRETYVKDSIASNKNALADAYVKFFRWAVDRLQNRDGIVCLVTNNSFVDQIAFDGMRKHFMSDFTRIYHLHLEGNVRHNPKLAGSMYNVFGIQVGVGITIAIRISNHRDHCLYFARIEKTLRKEAKWQWLAARVNLSGVNWKRLNPDSQHTWLIPENTGAFAKFMAIGDRASKADNGGGQTLFRVFSVGVKTNRDEVVYDNNRDVLTDRVRRFIEDYNAEVDRYKRAAEVANVDDFVRYERIKWSETLKANVVRGRYAEYRESDVRSALYRPFFKQVLFLNEMLVERRYQFHQILPIETTEAENQLIALTAPGSEKPFMILASSLLTDIHLVGAGAGCQCFPFYVYEEDGSNRRESVTDWALEQFRTHYKDKKIGKWDIFHYVYGLLHHPGYRTKFADNLKRELPRIPFAPDFKAFATAGKELARLHLDYESLEPYPLKFIETDGVPLSYTVEDKMRLTKDKAAVRANASLTLAGIPPEAFQYRLGNRSALEWVIDQYQVTEDKRSGIRSDPNRPDDPEYIVRLIGQVVRVSLETVKIVSALPEDYGFGG
jgi:predicted helicase